MSINQMRTHSVKVLFLIHDNGNGRVVEYTPLGEVVWEFGGLQAPAWGWIEKIWNGNYVFNDAFGSRIIEVDSRGNLIKELRIDGMEFVQAKAFQPEILSR